jgi:hypothetical protein
MLASDLALALDPALLMRTVGLDPDPWQGELVRTEARRTLLLCAPGSRARARPRQ